MWIPWRVNTLNDQIQASIVLIETMGKIYDEANTFRMTTSKLNTHLTFIGTKWWKSDELGTKLTE
jgi:hypothetical protein